MIFYKNKTKILQNERVYMKLRIKDIDGVRSGIKIYDVNAIYEERNSMITITGMVGMNNPNIIKNSPGLICNIVGKNGIILYSQKGKILYSVLLNNNAPFEIKIDNIINHVILEEIDEFQISTYLDL